MVNPTTTNQLFKLDTSVSTPVISGSLYQSAGVVVNQTYYLSNIDEDVVEVFIGPSAIGCVVHDFVNNGDGSGTCLVDFSSNYVPRFLSVIAQDDVGNLSVESNVLLIGLEILAGLGKKLNLFPPDPFYKTSIDRMLATMPKGEFVLSCQYLIPYSPNSQPFVLEVTDTTRTINISIMRRGFASEPTRYQFRLATPRDVVYMKLSKGENIIEANDGYERVQISVVTAHWATLVHGIAQEIYEYSGDSIQEQKNTMFSPSSTRLAEHLIDFYDILPNVQSIRNLSSKAAIRLFMNQSGTQLAVNDIIAACCGTTPIFRSCRPENTMFEPAVYPLFNNAESFGGVDAHVWLANPCVALWKAFSRYVNNMFKIVSLTESEIVFYDDNGLLKRYEFDSSASECSLSSYLARSTCVPNVVDAWFISNVLVAFCAAAYTHDLCFSTFYPLGMVRVYLDSGIPFDSGVPFDEYYEDPGDDGWIDFCILSHLDAGPVWDSMGSPPFDNGAEAEVTGSKKGPFYISGKTLEVQIGSGAVQTFTFTGTNPISAYNVVETINGPSIWWELSVISKEVVSPPSSVPTGSRYLVAANPTGGFTGHPLEIATKKYPENIFSPINTVSGTNSSPIAITSPCNVQLVIGSIFDGDGHISITGLDSNGLVLVETIPVSVSDAGTTIQGTITFDQLTRIDWDWGPWTKGKVEVQIAWVFKFPYKNSTVYVNNESIYYKFNSASWNVFVPGGPSAVGFRASSTVLDQLQLQTTGYVHGNTITVVGGTAPPLLGFTPGDTATTGVPENFCVYPYGYATVMVGLQSVDVDCAAAPILSGSGTIV